MTDDYFKDAIAEPSPSAGLLMPLFDRLTLPLTLEEEQGESCKRFYTPSETLASIEREICRLLNTRLSLEVKRVEALSKEEDKRGLPGFYGIPDFSAADGFSASQWPELQRFFQKVIEFYEPRLTQLKVKIQEFDKTQHCLVLSISGKMTLSNSQKEVSFPVKIHS